MGGELELKEILLLGNGYDLCHNLPTKYTDFLKYISKGGYEEIGVYSSYLLDEFKKLIYDNFWIEYFSNKQYESDNWIGFEGEMRYVIAEIEEALKNYKPEIDYFLEFSDNYLDELIEKHVGVNDIQKIYYDSLCLIRAYEIYICACVNTVKVYSECEDLANLKPDDVITFNYSDTFERIHDGDFFNIYHVHGKAKQEANLHTTNIVLGIDEYLPDGEESKNLQFVRFKKYFQRLQKHNDADYLLLIDDIRKKWELTSASVQENYRESLCHEGGYTIPGVSDVAAHLTIFGHSLGETDGDILSSLICNDNVQTTIYYKDEDTYALQLINLIKIIGKKEVLKRTGGSTRTIWFTRQKSNKNQEI